jgi:hypothetical protein
MPFKQNVGGGVSAAKDTATEADVRYPKTFHAGTGTKARIGEIFDCPIRKILPQKLKQMIPKGNYIAEDIEISGDENLDAKNIRAKTSIFGVVGDDNVVDTSDGTLSTGAMLKGVKGYSKGASFDGDIETLSDASFSPADSTAYNNCKITGSTENNYVGAFDYSVKGYIAGKIRIHIANLISSNIRSGVKVGGIGGYIEGSFTGDATASEGDIVNGKTAGVKGSMKKGTLPENSAALKLATINLDTSNSRLQMTIPETGKYNTESKLYAAYDTVRSLIGLTASKIAIGTTILGLDGSYKGLGDAAAGNVLSGKKFSTASLSNAEGTMTNRGAVSQSLNPGGSYTVPAGYHNGSGKVTAKTKYVKQISAMAARGFNATSNEPGPEEESFTMPAAGTVYYGGMSACYNASGNVVCEIYKNGAVVDHRNIDSNNKYCWRGTMHKNSFAVAAGDVVKVKAATSSGTHAISTIDAAIVYFA